MPLAQKGNALGRGNDTGKADAAGTVPFEQIDGCVRRPAGGEHGVEDDCLRVRELGRQLLVVAVGDRGLLVPFQTDESHLAPRYEVAHGVEHGQTGAEDRDKDHASTDDLAVGLLQRSLDAASPSGQVFEDMKGEYER